MTEKELKLRCLEIILEAAIGEKGSGNETAISELGGYNRCRMFQAKNLTKTQVGNLWRFILNIYLVRKDRDILYRAANKVLELIFIVAEEDGMKINAEHKHSY